MKTLVCQIDRQTGLSLNKQEKWNRVRWLLTFVLVMMGCSPAPEDKMTPFLPGAANLVIIYKKGTTNEQINYFLDYVLAHPRADGRGSEFLPAIKLRGRLKEKSGYDSTAIGYYPYATLEQREDVKRAALSSPIVYKVLEDVVPSQIKQIE